MADPLAPHYGERTTFDEITELLAYYKLEIPDKTRWLIDQDYRLEFLSLVEDMTRKNYFKALKTSVKTHRYFLTLTLPQELSDPLILHKGAQDIFKSVMFDIRRLEGHYELHEDGRPHLHCIITSGKYIDIQKVAKLYKYRFDLQKVKWESALNRYCNKESENEKILKFLQTAHPTIFFSNQFILDKTVKN